MADKRRCMIGICAFQGAEYKVLENYMALAFHLGRRNPEFDFSLKVIGKKEQFRARNNMIDIAKQWMTGEDDLLWMLDDDMIVPKETFEILCKALDSKPDAGVMGALYWQRGGTYRPVIQKIVQKGEYFGTEWYSSHEITGDVMQVGITGGGCLLFPMRAIRSLMPPVFWVDGIVGTDIHVCTRLNQAGWNVYCHTGLELGHLDEGRTITNKNLPEHFKRYSQLCKNLEESACEYMNMDRNELEQYQMQNIYTLEKYWETGPRENFEQIIEAYNGIGKASVARNVYYATHSGTGIEGFSDLYDNCIKGLISRDKPCLDYGCGVGVATEILASNGFKVDAADLAGNEVLNFLQWRLTQHGLMDKVNILHVNGLKPVLKDKYSLVVMLDILEHLMNPKEMLDDLLGRIQIGGHFHCNFAVMDFKGEEFGIHQHLKRITLNEFEDIINKHKMETVGTFLYRKGC
jgi:2-polyprenyl-3-methyl-5-hydroxy-6-metoxy-1,4-benzoquinol methylase